MSINTPSILKELRADPRFPALVDSLLMLVPPPLSYKISREVANSDQSLDWIYNSGQIDMANLFLAYLTGKADNE